MDPAGHHAEPFGEALSHSSQRAAQLFSLVAAAAEVAAHRIAGRNARQAARDEQTRRALHKDERAAHQQARTRWAPAHDPRWLAQAGLLQAARTWSAAAPYGTEPDAAAAMRKSEERLRTLHPYAMNRYDRLRSEGVSPLDAMRETAPLFARQPHARPGQPGTRPQIGAAPPSSDSGSDAGHGGNNVPEPAPEQDLYQDAEHRGRQITRRLQAHAQAERGAELTPDELATALEEKTTLPTEVIARLARADSEERVAAGAERARATDFDHAADGPVIPPAAERDTASAHSPADRAAARLAAESFPRTAADGIRAAVTGSLQQPARSPARVALNPRHPGLSP